MPLDPLVKAFLDRAAQIPRPKTWEVPPAIARQSFTGMMQLTGPKDVAVGKVENFTIRFSNETSVSASILMVPSVDFFSPFATYETAASATKCF